MNQSIQNGVGQVGIAEILMPMRDEQLTGDQRGLALVPIVEDLEQIAPGLGGERSISN